MNKETRQSTSIQLRAVNRDQRTVDVIASTFDIDSHGTRIDQSGWVLDRFLANPVICLQHDDRGYTGSNGLPVAKAIPETVRVENGKLVMRLQFPEKGAFPLADTVFSLVADGFLRGVSVGFQPEEWEDVDEEEDGYKKSVRVFKKQILLETSLVTIPSNDKALVQRSIDQNADITVIRRMTEQMERELDEQSKPSEQDIELWRSYFEQKQPANKASTKVLKAFYEKVLKCEPPANEVEAWTRMGEAVEALEETEDQDEIDTELEEPGEIVEETKEAIAELAKEEPTPPTTPPAETPQAAQKNSVQIPLDQLPHLFSRVKDACVDAAVKASRQGVPKSEWDATISVTGAKLQETLLSHSL